MCEQPFYEYGNYEDDNIVQITTVQRIQNNYIVSGCVLQNSFTIHEKNGTFNFTDAYFDFSEKIKSEISKDYFENYLRNMLGNIYGIY